MSQHAGEILITLAYWAALSALLFTISAVFNSVVVNYLQDDKYKKLTTGQEFGIAVARFVRNISAILSLYPLLISIRVAWNFHKLVQ